MTSLQSIGKVADLLAAANAVLAHFMPTFPDSRAVDDCLVQLAVAVAAIEDDKGATHGETGHECDAECMDARPTYCEEPRYGMYVPNSTCGALATHKAAGRALCAVHARRAVNEGREVEALS